MDESTSNLKFKHLDISAIIRLISPLGENQLSNEEFEYWYTSLNNGEKKLLDFLNRIKPSINRTEIAQFVLNPFNFDLNLTYTINTVVSNSQDDKFLVDLDDRSKNLRYRPSTLNLEEDSLTEVVGKFKQDTFGYYFEIESFNKLMDNWGGFKF
jgi:hypothetical protein